MKNIFPYRKRSHAVCFDAGQNNACSNTFQGHLLSFCICLVVVSCKPDETEIRQYLPNQFSDADLHESTTVPFMCASAVFLATFSAEGLSKVANVRAGPISSNVPDNSVVYRIVKNAEKGCTLNFLEVAGLKNIPDYLDAAGTYYIAPAVGKLVIFDPMRGAIVFLEG